MCQEDIVAFGSRKPKILIIGHARHGKDTVADIMESYLGYTYSSSSQAAADIFIYDILKGKYGYVSPEECFEDRVNHRSEWYDMICEYNKDDKSRLAREILKTSDMYIGMRDAEEIRSCKQDNLFDYVIGVYDSRKPLECKSSFNIDLFKESDFIIPNSGSIEDLIKRIINVIGSL